MSSAKPLSEKTHVTWTTDIIYTECIETMASERSLVAGIFL